MTCNTHIAFGCAIGSLIMMPDNFKYLAITLAGSAIGSVISDADVTTSESHQDLVKIFSVTFISILLCIAIESKFHIGIYKLINRHTNLYNMFIGFILSLIVCFYGIHKPHRTFMHSFSCVGIFIIILNSSLPVLTIPFCIGIISHIFLDLFNHRKVQIFYPFHKKYGFNLCSSNGVVNNIIFIVSVMVIGIEMFLFFLNI